MLHMVRSLYPDVPAACYDALLYPETRAHIKRTPNVIMLRPKKSFRQVIEKYGYPVISKAQSQFIHEVQSARSETPTKRLRLTGIKSDGSFSQMSMISRKWLYLCNAPFEISDRCCFWLKHRPMREAVRRFGHPFVGIRVDESQRREQMYYRHGCNAIDLKNPRSWPLAFWTEQDVWEYVKRFSLPYSTVYDMGYRRTGCMFCAFGVHLEEAPNRFQRMARTHPKHWKVCMGKLGMAEVLEYIGVDYNLSPQAAFWDWPMPPVPGTALARWTGGE